MQRSPFFVFAKRAEPIRTGPALWLPARGRRQPRMRGLRRFLSNDIPSCLSFRPSSVLRQPLHSPTMRLLSRLEDER